MANSFKIKANLVDIKAKEIFPAEICVKDTKIASIHKIEEQQSTFILPGFIDAHVHIESSMVTPLAFSQAACPFGTVATVSDPHEIANVCGIEGIQFMIENSKHAALKIHFGAPSCVPATNFETAGAKIDSAAINTLIQSPDIYYLAEMMNFPGVLHNDPEVLKKIALTQVAGKPIDGHAPGLRGKDAADYIACGISTDHECTTLEEAIEKAQLGMKILIREGSAAKNFEALVPLFAHYSKQIMFCSDDKHPDELIKGHINQLVIRAIDLGYPLFDVLNAACIAPVEHYKLPVGRLQEGDWADFIIVKDLKQFEVIQTYINGTCIAENGLSKEIYHAPMSINNFKRTAISMIDLISKIDKDIKAIDVKTIVALDGQLITEAETISLPVINRAIQTDISKDVLKIVVCSRYENTKPAVAFIKNFGLKTGAIASSIGHDSHNIIAVGVEDDSILNAINILIKNKGGISVCDKKDTFCMPLPIAGLMSDKNAFEAAEEYEILSDKAKALGSTLSAPFMTLSFMALPVIPKLKITDKGLFNVNNFNFTTML
ncbi:MAG TPA: adenine deaminase [Edaphocola sp.]|nr:adenine deaminase [Edaphocola sp.]